MIRLLRYLKPFTLLIVLAVALLFVQAMADLALPDYMSRIVNTGIQQGGVESGVPTAVRQSRMDKLLLFMDPAEQAQVLAAYTLVDSASPDLEHHIRSYPRLAEEPVYVLNDSARGEIGVLNPVLGKALLAVSGIEQALADPSQAPAPGLGSGMDLSQLPPGTDPFEMLAQIPEPQRAQLTATMGARFAAMDDDMIVQMAAGPVRAEYAALGLDAAKLQSGYILRTGGLMLLLALLSAVCAVAVGFLSAKAAAGFARDLRRLIFRKIESFGSSEFDQFSTASLITRSTNDVTQMQMVVIMSMRMVFYAPIVGIGGVIRAVSKSSSMWWIIALAVIVLISLVLLIFSISLSRFQRIQSLIDRLNLVTRENLSGMMVIRAFNRQGYEEQRFDRANRDLTSTMLFVSRVMIGMMPVMMLIMNGLMLTIIWVGAQQVAQSSLQVGDMMAFMQYAMQIVMSFLMLSMMFIFLPRASVSGDRIADVLETEPAIRDPEDPKPFSVPFTGSLEFRNVCFRYPGAEEDVLHDITFAAQPGQTTGIIGATGCGKSTLVNLIPRFYDVTSGAIYIDNLDIRDVRQHDLRDKIGYVPQKAGIFSGTIESNLRYADEEAAGDTLQEVVRIAQATELIESKPEGMAAEIAQGGANVSGGQKQRLSIARALVKKPPIYIYDDSFSALDLKTDAALRKALREHTGSSTVLIVTQRISTIKNAEQIIVLHEGRIVGQGTHRELLASCETYRGIALSQLSKEELA